MSDQTTTIENTQEQRKASFDNVEQYVKEILKKDDKLIDTDGLPRPSFVINNKRVIFRNRQETPSLEGQKIHIVAGQDTAPLLVKENEDLTSEYELYLENSVAAEASEFFVVTNTPEGLLNVALEFDGYSDEGLIAMRRNIVDDKYGEHELAFLDGVIAMTEIEADGKPKRTFDTDAFAVIVAALSGDKIAQQFIVKRIEVFHETMAQTEAERQVRAEAHSAEYNASTEALKPEEVALVHSTSHEIVRDENGTIILRPSSAHRTDKYPRSTVHFTVNGQVTSHMMGGWNASNKLIVANMAKVADAQGRYPEIMADVDTYYALDPGESLELDGALVVEGDVSMEGLIDETDAGTVYKISENYTADEQKDISELAKQYGVRQNEESRPSDVLREVALRITMKRQGAKQFVTAGAHYVDDPEFQKAYSKLATQVGSIVGLHANMGDSSTEQRAFMGMAGSYRAEADGIDDAAAYYPSSNATLAARRQVVASGYMPARPLAMKRLPSLSSDLF